MSPGFLDHLLEKDNISFLRPRVDECLLNGSITLRDSFFRKWGNLYVFVTCYQLRLTTNCTLLKVSRMRNAGRIHVFHTGRIHAFQRDAYMWPCKKKVPDIAQEQKFVPVNATKWRQGHQDAWKMSQLRLTTYCTMLKVSRTRKPLPTGRIHVSL